MAYALSDLLRGAVTSNTSGTYASGFRSLQEFCSHRRLSCLPVDVITLCAWACFKGRFVKPKTILKYVCGIRHVHLTGGFEWPFSHHPLLKMAITALRKLWPDDDKLRKVPLSLDFLLAMCGAMAGWPCLAALSFDDLLWACASSVAFFAALRGGEFFTYPKALRPVLLRKNVSVVVGGGRRYVKINVVQPKTRPGISSEQAFAASPGAGHVLDPVTLWLEFDARRRRLGHRLISEAVCPAFAREDGTAITRKFMVGRARALCKEAGLQVFDSDGNIVQIAAASWRAGFVLSARSAKVDEATIRAVGRWASASGPTPYTFDSTETIQLASQSIAFSSAGISGVRSSSSFAGGHYASSSIVELGPHVGGDSGACIQL
jgi:hypothetical protein